MKMKKKKSNKTDVSSQYTKYQSLQLESAVQNWERRPDDIQSISCLIWGYSILFYYFKYFKVWIDFQNRLILQVTFKISIRDVR